MERPILTKFFKNKGIKEIHESYLKSPELYAYAQSMDNYCDWLEEKYNKYCNIHGIRCRFSDADVRNIVLEMQNAAMYAHSQI